MFLLNLKIAFRNLFKNKLYAFINMGGLAMGMLSFILISLYINYEKSFDQWSPDLERVYVVRNQYKDYTSEGNDNTLMYPLKALLEQKVKGLEGVALLKYESGILQNGQKKLDGFTIASVTDNYFSVFPHTIIAGDALAALRTPNGLILSKSAALKIFGSANVIGKTLQISNYKSVFTVNAIYDDELNRSYSSVDVYLSLQAQSWMDWGNYAFEMMVKLQPDANPDAVIQEMQKYYVDARARSSKQPGLPNQLLTEEQAIKILTKYDGTVIDRLNYHPVKEENTYGEYKQATRLILQGLSILLMLIAGINFTNLAIVQAGKRAKEVGVRKILGSKKNALIFQFVLESLIPCLLSLGIALVASELLIPSFNQFLNIHLSIYDIRILPKLILQIMALLTLIILIAGLYPALFIASFLPIKVLKGNFNRSSKGILLRKILITVQFTISALFLMCFWASQRQLSYLKKIDLGVNIDHVLKIDLSTKLNKFDFDAYRSTAIRLKNIAGVQQVSRYNRPPFSGAGVQGAATYKTYSGTVADFAVDVDFLSLMQAKITKGRGFSEANFATDTAMNMFNNRKVVNAVVNESFLHKMSIQKPYIDEVFERNGRNYRIIGVVENMKLGDINSKVEPGYYAVNHVPESFYNIYLKLDGKHDAQTLQAIRKYWETEFDTGLAMKYTYLTDALDKSMASQTRLATIMLLFSIVTFIITLLGIFALAAYTARMRTREIAVRRVMGASVQDILLLLNKDFIRLTLIGSAIAIVAAYLLMQKWLAQFAYRIDMPYWIFVCVALLLLLVTIITVTLQGIQSARTKPVTALSYE